MVFHRGKITIIVEQSQSFHDTKSCYDDINGFPYGNTSFSKGAVIIGTLDGDIVSTDLAERESAKEVLGCFEIFVCSEALKDLSENQIPNDNGGIGKVIVERVCLPCRNAVEIIDPYG